MNSVSRVQRFVLSSCLLLIFSFLLLQSLPGEDEIRYSGIILVKGVKMFTFRGNFSNDNGHLVKADQYFSLSGKKVLEDSTQVRVEDMKIEEHRSVNYETGRTEIIRRSGDSLLVSFKKNEADEFRSKLIKDDEQVLITDTVVTPYVLNNLNNIIDNGTKYFKFIVPARLAVYSFRIYLVDNKSLYDQDCYILRMEPSSWLYRRFVKPSFFYVDKVKTDRLVRYEGQIAPTEADGKVLNGVSFVTYE